MPRPPPAPPAEEADQQARSRSTISRSRLGYALLPLVKRGRRHRPAHRADQGRCRRSLAMDLGFVMPAVRILDNVLLEANTYAIKIKEVRCRHRPPSGRGQFMGHGPPARRAK